VPECTYHIGRVGVEALYNLLEDETTVFIPLPRFLGFFNVSPISESAHQAEGNERYAYR
jgi:hypothetical protein